MASGLIVVIGLIASASGLIASSLIASGLIASGLITRAQGPDDQRLYSQRPDGQFSGGEHLVGWSLRSW